MKPRLLHFIYSVLLRNLLRIIPGIHIRNQGALTGLQQCIFVANHNSHFDSIALMSALPHDLLLRTHPVLASDYFRRSGWVRRLTDLLTNAIMVPRNRPQAGETAPDPIQMMLEVLERGDSLIVYPEGTRGRPGKMEHFRTGIGILLRHRPDVPYVPVYLKGVGRLIPRPDSFFTPFDAFILFGEPTFCQAQTVEDIVAEVEDDVLRLRDSSV